MNSHKKIVRSMPSILIKLILLIFVSTATAQNNTSPLDQVCSNNDYALCSHANCTCLDEEGKEGECDMYDFNNPESSGKGWAMCECPVVKHSSNLAYNFNYATLGCDVLDDPHNKPGNSLPPFDYLKDKKVDVYSTYSYGDSLNNHNFGTLKDAELIICDEPKRQTLCLDMPCTLSEDGKVAECYCQNTEAEQQPQECAIDTFCPKQTMWNTLTNDCNTDFCDPGKGQIRSAAYVYQTMLAIGALHVSINQKIPGFKQVPRYCRTE